jgi:hypothetical protein
MSTKTPNDHEPVELDDRTERALTQYLSVLDDVGRAKGAEDLYLVVSESGKEYLVDRRTGACECPDHEHRRPEGGCKHRRRVAFATGEKPVPSDVEDVDPQLGEHVDGAPQVVATDGGVVRSADRSRVPVAGGVLVYESSPDGVGRELVGFEDVTDWSAVRSALQARGHGVGAVYHLPVLDDSTRPEPRRSEPADFGHGDSTGVQNL